MRFPSQTPSQPAITAVLAVCLILLASSLSYGQRPAPAASATPIPPPQTVQDKDDGRGDFGSAEAEMRSKLAIKADKKDYEENLARAREVADLATQIMQSYQTSKTLTSEDNKKLDRLEKLTKRIRNEAGGSESDAEAKDLPKQMAEAVKCIVDLSGELKTLVEKTPRHVVSAAVIDQANKLLVVVQYMRSLSR